jgi:hypothetical protein
VWTKTSWKATKCSQKCSILVSYYHRYWAVQAAPLKNSFYRVGQEPYVNRPTSSMVTYGFSRESTLCRRLFKGYAVATPFFRRTITSTACYVIVMELEFSVKLGFGYHVAIYILCGALLKWIAGELRPVKNFH